MAFLIQHVFQHHKLFSVHIYSLTSSNDSGPELDAIRSGSDTFTVLSPTLPAAQLAAQIRADSLDILIDLCGYTGTSLIAEILTHQPAPLQIAYMGFPSTTAAPYLHYMIADTTVVPMADEENSGANNLRQYYTENMIWMPHSYFVNSHATCCPLSDNPQHDDGNEEEHRQLRQQYGLPQDAFVFACHNRPDKIDPATFTLWIQTLVNLQQQQQHHRPTVLWLLRSGPAMERHLRTLAESLSLPPESLIFCSVVPRPVHLRRLRAADLFLDTPAYNAHTLGCDALFAAVPMITLLRSRTTTDTTGKNDDPLFVPTDKLPSRVGASLVRAAGLDELVAETMEEYRNLMERAVRETGWLEQHRQHLLQTRYRANPLFDTQRWTENLEAALEYLVVRKERRNVDILIEDDEG